MKILLLVCLLFGYSRGIYNGIVAQPGQFPWAVQIYPSGCSASIVHTNGWVFSAAHCLSVPVNGRVCRSLINGWVNPSGQVNCNPFVAGHVYFNPGWPTEKWIGPNDIVIVRLTEDFTNLPGYGPVAIPLVRVNFALDEQVTIVGFGQVRPDTSTDVLRWQTFNRIPGDILGPSFVGAYYAAVNPASAILPGDSGSGWVMVRNNQQMIIGVTCCGNFWMGGRGWSTSISNQLPWVHNILGIPGTSVGCPMPTTCPLTAIYPMTDPRGVYQCMNGIVTATFCGGDTFFTRNGCARPPIPTERRFECQDWSLVGITR
jgi:hypothetical protein